jgi:hypothetical protein
MEWMLLNISWRGEKAASLKKGREEAMSLNGSQADYIIASALRQTIRRSSLDNVAASESESHWDEMDRLKVLAALSELTV